MSEVMLKTENLGISFGGLKAVQNLNLEIKEKQLYGLVGPNGAGKTTVTNLLSRFYEIESGQITIDGVPIEQIDTTPGPRNENYPADCIVSDNLILNRSHFDNRSLKLLHESDFLSLITC